MFFEEGDLCKHLDSSSLMPYLCVIEFVVGDDVGKWEIESKILSQFVSY